MKQRMTLSVCLLVLLVLLCTCALADGFTLSGCAYVDDGSGTLMAGVPVTLQSADGEALAETVTDAYGQYAFTGLAAGDYRVLCTVNDAALCAASIGGSQLFADGAVYADVALQGDHQADVALCAAAELSVEAYQDSSSDGKRGKYERDLSGVQVEVLMGENVIASGETGKKGSLTLSVLPGDHALRVTLPESYVFSPIGEDNFVTAEDGVAVSDPVTLTAGAETSVAIGAQILGSLSGKAFEDMNNNGLMDEGEPGAEGVVIHLEGSRTGVKRDLTTDATGEYCFDRLPDDLYTISATLPQGMLYARYSKTGGDLRSIFTGSNITREFSVKSAAHVTNRNIGVVQKGVIHGTAFLDLNYNGVMDEGEPGYKGVTTEAIKLSNSESLGKSVTGEDGAFRLENLRGGDYRLRAVLPDDGSMFTVAVEGDPAQVNRFAYRAGRRENSVQPLTIESGGEAEALVGVALGATIKGTVYQDADYNGRKNGKEKILSGVKIRAIDENGQIAATDTTGQKGQYVLSGLMPGSYVVQVQRKSDMGFTRLRPEEDQGSWITVMNEEGWGVTDPITLAMGETIEAVNAGMLPSATVSGQFFHDANDNGQWDKEEAGMVQAEIRLLSEDGEIDLYRTPAADGSYLFDGVMPGKYTVTYLLPEHCEMARTTAGGNTVAHDGLETVTSSFTIEMGEDYEMPLAGAVTLGSFCGGAFGDSNANGLRDGDEEMLPGVLVTLFSASGDEFAAESDENGAFEIAGLRPDDYHITVELPDGYIFSDEMEADDLLWPANNSQTLLCPWSALISRSEKAIGAVQPASIAGVIWMDENRDSQRAEDEWIMEGLTLSLIDESTGEEAAQTVSDQNGFLFENVRPGSYTVQFELPYQSSPANDYGSTFAASGSFMKQSGVSVSEGEAADGLTTGLVSLTSIGGTAWLDEGGQRTPVSGMTVTLYADGSAIQTAVTDENGGYRFDGLWPGEYALQAQQLPGTIFVRPDDPNYEQGASVIAYPDMGASDEFSLYMAQHQLEQDILCIKPAKVGDIAWLDENRNGLIDGSEPRLMGVTVQLVQDGEVIYETVTDDNGYYLFGDVYPGTYTLRASAYAELSPTTPVESLRIISSCLIEGDGLEAYSEPLSVVSGVSDMNCDLGYILLDGCVLPEEAIAPMPSRDWRYQNSQDVSYG